MVHAIMGEDTKALTKDEEIQSYFLEQYRRESAASEEASWDNRYLTFLNSMKGTSDYDAAIQMPHRAKTGRSGKKGDDFVFKIGNSDGGIHQLTAEEAIGLFEAIPSEEPKPLSESFDRIYQATKSHLFQSDSQDKNEKQRIEALQKIKVMMTKKALPSDYLKDLKKVIENDGLSGFELRFINKLKPSEYSKLPGQIDNYYISRIIETYNHVDDGEESLILAEELQ